MLKKDLSRRRSTVNYPLGDTVARIRNGYLAELNEIFVLKSKLILTVLNTLKNHGYIKDYIEGPFNIKVILSYHEKGGAIKDIRLISTPGSRKYCKSTQIPISRNGFGIYLLTTPKGIMAGYEAAEKKLGGEILMEVF